MEISGCPYQQFLLAAHLASGDVLIGRFHMLSHFSNGKTIGIQFVQIQLQLDFPLFPATDGQLSHTADFLQSGLQDVLHKDTDFAQTGGIRAQGHRDHRLGVHIEAGNDRFFDRIRQFSPVRH